MSSVPVATVEILNDLLDAELNSVFRFMGEGSPYLNGATAAVRAPLAAMVEASTRRAHELYDLIEGLGGSPVPRGLRSEEQYLAFLSLKFLLPKLVHEKQLAIRRWQSALAGVRTVPAAPREAMQLLESHLAELNRELQSLEQATTHVTPAPTHSK
ncbi:MAG: hypothetical protein H7Z14_07960 [Anaerolineae bacterium]|nr:hypothetical protein [Phycisphaerae bacterium]